MTFGALAWTAWVFVAAAGALAAWLFLLKLRAPRMPVPSMLLWRRVLDESREQTLWERIRRAVSLALTILIALALALAAAALYTRNARAGREAAGRLLIVIDSSWSMLARTSTGETRWERAVAQARRLSAAAGDSELALATTADGLVEGPTTDRALVDTALERLTPGGDHPAAWPRLPASGSVHFITDGTVARPLDKGVVVHSVFERAANVAVTAFDVRPSLTSDYAGQAYLEIANYALSAQPVRLVLTAGPASLIDRRVQMAAGEALRQVVPIPRGGDGILRVRVEARENALDIDDEAVAWVERPRPLALAMVGEDTSWLRTLFESDPGVRATTLAPDAYPRGTERADVVIFDRWSPREPPPIPALYFSPPADRGTEEQHPRWETSGSHAVVRGVDPFTLTISRARAYTSPDLLAVARSARGTPLVYVRESPERRAVLVTFSPAESNLTAAPAFPVLVGNAIDWLTTLTISGQPLPAARRAGLVTFASSVAAVTGPRGSPVPLTRVGDAAIGTLRAPGLYEIRGGGARSAIAINAGDPQTSNLARTTLTAAHRSASVMPGGSRTPWWIYCAVAAFALALAEWWTWQRRITV